MEHIQRDEYDAAGPGDIDVRLYEDTSRPEIPKLPSVTTVLKTREQDKSHLYDWQDRNDGAGNNADHEHLFWYSRHLGTLGHWFALNELGEVPWTEDEGQSLWALQNVGTLDDPDEDYTAIDPRTDRVFSEPGDNHTEVLDASAREVLYSVLRGDRDKAGGTVQSWGEFYDKHPPYKRSDYYEQQLLDQARRDLSFFVDAQQRLWSKLGIENGSVISVEQYMFNDTDGYAGQVDLVYEDPEGYTVVADLKSSSGCYDKHQLQGAAYARAVTALDDPDAYPDIYDIGEVDRLEVHRVHPRTGQMAVHTHADAPGQQPIHTTKYWNDGIETLTSEFLDLVVNFDGYDWTSE